MPETATDTTQFDPVAYLKSKGVQPATFDPVAYLKEKGVEPAEFDPVAYLKEKGVIPEVPLEHKDVMYERKPTLQVGATLPADKLDQYKLPEGTIAYPTKPSWEDYARALSEMPEEEAQKQYQKSGILRPVEITAKEVKSQTPEQIVKSMPQPPPISSEDPYKSPVVAELSRQKAEEQALLERFPVTAGPFAIAHGVKALADAAHTLYPTLSKMVGPSSASLSKEDFTKFAEAADKVKEGGLGVLGGAFSSTPIGIGINSLVESVKALGPEARQLVGLAEKPITSLFRPTTPAWKEIAELGDMVASLYFYHYAVKIGNAIGNQFVKPEGLIDMIKPQAYNVAKAVIFGEKMDPNMEKILADAIAEAQQAAEGKIKIPTQKRESTLTTDQPASPAFAPANEPGVRPPGEIPFAPERAIIGADGRLSQDLVSKLQGDELEAYLAHFADDPNIINQLAARLREISPTDPRVQLVRGPGEDIPRLVFRQVGKFARSRGEQVWSDQRTGEAVEQQQAQAATTAAERRETETPSAPQIPDEKREYVPPSEPPSTSFAPANEPAVRPPGEVVFAPERAVVGADGRLAPDLISKLQGNDLEAYIAHFLNNPKIIEQLAARLREIDPTDPRVQIVKPVGEGMPAPVVTGVGRFVRSTPERVWPPETTTEGAPEPKAPAVETETPAAPPEAPPPPAAEPPAPTPKPEPKAPEPAPVVKGAEGEDITPPTTTEAEPPRVRSWVKVEEFKVRNRGTGKKIKLVELRNPEGFTVIYDANGKVVGYGDTGPEAIANATHEVSGMSVRGGEISNVLLDSGVDQNIAIRAEERINGHLDDPVIEDFAIREAAQNVIDKQEPILAQAAWADATSKEAQIRQGRITVLAKQIGEKLAPIIKGAKDVATLGKNAVTEGVKNVGPLGIGIGVAGLASGFTKDEQGNVSYHPFKAASMLSLAVPMGILGVKKGISETAKSIVDRVLTDAIKRGVTDEGAIYKTMKDLIAEQTGSDARGKQIADLTERLRRASIERDLSRRVSSTAYEMADGTIIVGNNHGMAAEEARKAGYTDEQIVKAEQGIDGYRKGYVNRDGTFYTTDRLQEISNNYKAIKTEVENAGGTIKEGDTGLPTAEFPEQKTHSVLTDAEIKRMLREAPEQITAAVRQAGFDANKLKTDEIIKDNTPKELQAEQLASATKRNGFVAEYLMKGQSKQQLAARYDAMGNDARIDGRRAGNSLRIRVKSPMDDAALPWVIQSGGDTKVLARWIDEMGEKGDQEYGRIVPRMLGEKKILGETEIIPYKAYGGTPITYNDVVRHAIANAEKLKPYADYVKQLHDSQLQQEQLAGIGTEEIPNYVTAIYKETMMMPDGTLWIPKQIRNVIEAVKESIVTTTGRGRNTDYFTKHKLYKNFAEAITAGEKPRTLSMADLLEYRIRRGQNAINEHTFFEAMRHMSSPFDGKPIVQTPDVNIKGEDGKIITVPRSEVYFSKGQMYHQDKPVQFMSNASPEGYTMLDIQGKRNIYVNDKFHSLFNALFAPSITETNPALRTVMNTYGLVKHLTLLFDSFHAGRVMQKEFFMRGKISYKKGLSILEYTDADLKRLLDDKYITQEIVDYAQKNRTLTQALINEGLNVGRINENLYSHTIRDIPYVNKFNRWVFDKLSRGAILETALSKYEVNKRNFPDLNEAQVLRRTAREMNNFYGNLMSQGLFKSRTFQDLSRMIFLAPQWGESMLRTELRAATDVMQGAKRGVVAPFSKERVFLGVTGKATMIGVMATFALNQVVNKFTRGMYTWENPESDHLFDAFIPSFIGDNRSGYFYQPFSSLTELSHDLWRYYQRSSPGFEGLMQSSGRILSNKLAPITRGIFIFGSGKDWDGRPTQNILERAQASALAAAPIPLGLKAFVDPNAQIQRQMFSSMGMKIEPRAAYSPEATQALIEKRNDDELASYLASRALKDRENGKNWQKNLYDEVQKLDKKRRAKVFYLARRMMVGKQRARMGAEAQSPNPY